MKLCTRCRIEKPVSDFYPKRNSLTSWCKSCILDYAKTDAGKLSRKIHKNKNFDKYSQIEKQRKILVRYGLTVERYLSLFDLQDDKCLNPNCQIILEPYTKTACIDHDHKTGKVRGLLCQKCNVNLGWFENSRHWIESYLGA